MKILPFLLLGLFQTVHAEDIDTVVKRFYMDSKALSVRGALDGDRVDRCCESLTPSYNAAIILARKRLKAWRDAPERDTEEPGSMKPPFTEGAIFTGIYESGDFVKVKSTEEIGDRAYACVVIRLVLTKEQIDWLDFVVLHRIGDTWLIDDIISDIEGDQPLSVRGILRIP
ncbi:MAG: hypothetical protein ACSHX7_14925, partial [Luteolibacter sp.]